MLTKRSIGVYLVTPVALLAAGCAAPRAGDGAGAGAATPAMVTSPAPAAIAAVGDADAIQHCNAYQAKRRSDLGAAATQIPALNVTAGFDTTVGTAQRYADTIGVKPGDPGATPPASVEQDAQHTSTATATLCIIDGDIHGPGLPGHPPYTREIVLVLADGTFEALVLGQAKDIPLTRPS
jgi:hypothetical protein